MYMNRRESSPNAMGFTLASPKPHYAPNLGLEPCHVQIELRLDLQLHQALCKISTRVKARSTGETRLELNGVDFAGLEVQASEDIQWRYDGKLIEIAWQEAFERSEERTVTVSYRVEKPVTGLNFCSPDESYPDRPTVVCTDHETERARYWLACVDYPSVRTPIDFHITVAKQYSIVAGGLRQSEIENADGTKTAHWKLEQPCPSYLACLAAGELVRQDDGDFEGRELINWAVAPFDAGHLKRSFGRTAEMMSWMQTRLGVPFPYPKYHQIAVPEIGGAMENISLVSWDQGALMDEVLFSERGENIDAVNLHEMAHSYFGDMVVIRHFEHAWLKESWAVYMETVWWHETTGVERAHWDLYLNAQQYIGEVKSRYARPIVTRTYDSSWSMFDMHTYPGGAWRIHMLREQLGDEDFWAATKTYLERHAQSVVETNDFRRALEEQSGRNLTRFFDEWVHSPGFPQLKLEMKRELNAKQLHLSIEQTQVNPKKGIGLFHFPLEIFWVDSAGEHRQTLDMGPQRLEVNLPVEGQLERIEVDPELRCMLTFQFNPGAEQLRNSMAKGALRSRIWAAETLIKSGKPADLESVHQAMLKEPFQGVRASVAKALGASPSPASIDCLAALIVAEEDPRAQKAFAEAAGQVRSESLRSALKTVISSDPPRWPYFALGAAYTSLGSQHIASDYNSIAAGLTPKADLHDLTKRGAYAGLAELGTEQAFELLLENAPYGKQSEPGRPALVAALTRCAQRLGERACERAAECLFDLLRDPKSQVRMAAGLALSKLRGHVPPRTASALEVLKNRQAAQDTPKIQRWILALSKGGPSQAVLALQEESERLQSKLLELSKRLDQLESHGANTTSGTNGASEAKNTGKANQAGEGSKS